MAVPYEEGDVFTILKPAQPNQPVADLYIKKAPI